MNALEYAQRLVSFDSVSRKSNVAVTDCVQSALTELGFETERLEYDDEFGVRKASVVGRKGPPGAGGLAYFGHTDVVPADPWFSAEHGPFTPTVKDGRLYGRGSCDMKGSVSCMLAAAGIPASRLSRPLYITCTSDEEIGYGGAREVAARSQMYRAMVAGQSHAIIGEPTCLEVVYAHKGTYGLIATSRGRAAHSSTNKGLNANLAMIPFLVEMKALHDEFERDPKWHNTEFDPPTMSWNIGINDHTKAVNITPPQSVCTVYFRPMPGQDAEALIERARAAAERCGLEFRRAHGGPSLYVDPNSPFVQEVLRLAERKAPRTVAYGTDGVMLGELKNKVVLGPGDIAQAHTHDEWISLEQLDAGTALYARLIQKYCC